MADDQTPKTTTIDDLVKELSKSSSPNQPPSVSATTNQGPPSNLPGIKLDNKPSTSGVPVQPLQPIQPQPQPPPINVVKPPVFMSPKSTPNLPLPPIKPGVSAPLSTSVRPSPVQEYKSSIRTMDEDIASIKSGQEPTGVDIPRKITPEMPKTSMPGALKLDDAALAGPKSAIGLGRAEKTGLLPTVSQPKKPFEPTQISPESKKAQLGPSKLTETQPSITVPDSKRKAGRLFYFLIGGVLIIGGFLYWFLFMRVSTPEVVSPTPIQTTTPLITRNLNEIFVGIPVNFEVTLSNNLSQDFKTFVETLNVEAKSLSKINLFENINDTLAPINFIDMLDRDPVFYPAKLKENITDSLVMVYSQSEVFNSDGSINFNVQNQKKTAFLAKVKSKSVVETIMRDWEFTIVDDLANYLFIDDASKEASANFMDNTYRGVSIRYKNFPFPDITLDYAVLETSPSQTYLIIAGSRETIYTAIDILLEQ